MEPVEAALRGLLKVVGSMAGSERNRRDGRASAAGILLLVCLVVPLGALVFVTAPVPVAADARTDYLIRLLQTSRTFRVRAQAALSLGRLDASPEVTGAVSGALRDDHPAVRMAAAAALEQLGDPSALSALGEAARDRDETVRRAASRAARALERVARTAPQTAPVPPPDTGGAPRYYVGVGMPGSSVGALDRSTLEAARDFITQQVGGIDGVVVAPTDESNSAARRVLQRQRLTGYYIDSSIVRIEPRSGGTRAVVSVIVNTYPGRDMRVILQGAATVQGGGSGTVVQRQAIEGAFTGALRRLPQAMEASDVRSGG